MQMRLIHKILLIAFLCNTAFVQAEEELMWHLNVDLISISQGNIMAGADQKSFNDYWNVEVTLDLFYKGFFINNGNEPLREFIAPQEIGYELSATEEYSVDVIFLASYLRGFSEFHVENVEEVLIAELEGINERKDDVSSAFRFSRYFNNAIFWVDVAADIASVNHKGWAAESYFIYNLELANWDVRMGFGASFFSANMMDYYMSVSPDESTSVRPVYDAGKGTIMSADINANLPIAKNWMFRTGLRYEKYSSSFDESPLTENDERIAAWLGFRYVW